MDRLDWRRLWAGLSLIIAAWLLWMTLRPNQAVAADLLPLTAPAAASGVSIYALIDLAGNIAVFVPLGVTLALVLGQRPAPRRVLWATVLGSGLSLAIELLQAGLYSRVAQPLDWLLNTTGTALGAALVAFAGSRVRRLSIAKEEQDDRFIHQ